MSTAVPSLSVRAAVSSDRPAILTLVWDAFTSPGRDGKEEVEIVQATWSVGGADDCELVAVVEDRVVGHVLSAVGDLAGRAAPGVAPLAVTPGLHGHGIGSALMTEVIRRADEARWPLVVLLGSPDYYSRFGFEPSGPLGISYGPAGPGNPHFQVRRLSAYDPSMKGRFVYCWEGADSNSW